MDVVEGKGCPHKSTWRCMHGADGRAVRGGVPERGIQEVLMAQGCTVLPDSSVSARSRPCMDDMRRGSLG